MTLQIATFGPDDCEAIVSGIKNIPVPELAIICYDYDKSRAEGFANKVEAILDLSINLYLVSKENIVHDIMERINEILLHHTEYNQILVNVSSGEKVLVCLALSCSFVNGIKAYRMDCSKAYPYPILFPILNLSYNEIISATKIKILKTLDQAGGSLDSLKELEQASGLVKQKLNYHIKGGKDARGLVSLGLLNVERKGREKISIIISDLGKLLIKNHVLTLKKSRTQ